MRHLKAMHVVSSLQAPHEMVKSAICFIEMQKDNELQDWNIKSNQPDFVSTIAHVCEELGLPYTLILNGQKADLETVFKFFNKAYDLQREYLNNLKNEKSETKRGCWSCKYRIDQTKPYPVIRCQHKNVLHMAFDGNCELWEA